MSKEVRASLHISGLPPRAVWPLLTEGTHLERWFAEHAAVDLAAGEYCFWGRFTPDTPDSSSAHVTSVAATAPDVAGAGGRLNYFWQLRGEPTQVDLVLLPEGDGTLLRLHHSGLGVRINQNGAVHDFWYSVLANLQLYALTGRPQQFVEYGPKPGTSMTVEVDVAATPEAIFRYLIEPEFIAKVWQDENVRVEPIVGGVYDYGWTSGGPRRILALDPPHLLSFSWLYPPETAESTVTWRLEELGGGRTRLSLTHEGFSADIDHEEYRAGWFSFLALIKSMAELDGRWSRITIKGSQHGEA